MCIQVNLVPKLMLCSSSMLQSLVLLNTLILLLALCVLILSLPSGLLTIGLCTSLGYRPMMVDTNTSLYINKLTL